MHGCSFVFLVVFVLVRLVFGERFFLVGDRVFGWEHYPSRIEIL